MFREPSHYLGFPRENQTATPAGKPIASQSFQAARLQMAVSG